MPLFDAEPRAGRAAAPGRDLPARPAPRPRARRDLESVFIDTGENGSSRLEEFAAITTTEQMEFVTPEEIADVVVREIEGGNTGHDIINALDNAVLGPTYRAGLLRHWALEQMRDLEKQHQRPQRGLRDARAAAPLEAAVRGRPAAPRLRHHGPGPRRDRSRAVPPRGGARDRGCEPPRPRSSRSGFPILLSDGRLLRGPECKIPPVSAPDETHEVTAERDRGLGPARAGSICARANMAAWKARFERIEAETLAIPAIDTSSRFLRDRQFWGAEGVIQPGKVVGWIFATEEKGARMK